VIARPHAGTRRDLQAVVSLARKGQVSVHVNQFDLGDAMQALKKLEAGDIPAAPS
jgi:D-arabinose 1-dehydrogenase-like Zn-dependent alcohol dehydrogenase